MKWNHIMNKQPMEGERIVQCDPPFAGYYLLGERTYVQKCSFEEVLAFCKNNDLPPPNFWWVPASEFPFFWWVPASEFPFPKEDEEK